MKSIDIKNELDKLNGGWVHADRTVDTFKSGNPQQEITGIAVAWMSYTESIKKAIEMNCNLFITHEPTYYDHWENNPSLLQLKETQRKREFIENSGITILRCHDLWDQIQEIGIPDSWGDSFGFGKAVAGEGYFRVYDAEGRTVQEVAQRIAQTVRPYGQEDVQLIGPSDKRVNQFVVGTGAATPFVEMMEKYPQADLFICSDDGFVYWRDGAMAIDFNIPVIILNHPVTEFDGMRNLCAYLKQRFPDVPIHFIDQTCMYRKVK